MFSPKHVLSVPLILMIMMPFSGSAYGASIENRPLKVNQQIIHKTNLAVVSKSDQLNNTVQEVQTLQSKKQALVQQLEIEKNTLEQLRQRIAQKKASAKPVTPVVVPVAASVPASGPRSGCGDNPYAAYIYGMESGGRVAGNCDPSARNSGGCLGIGQACPGAKLLAVCPNLDYNCQNAFFTNYAISRYGSWASAYEAWKIKKWW